MLQVLKLVTVYTSDCEHCTSHTGLAHPLIEVHCLLGS